MGATSYPLGCLRLPRLAGLPLDGNTELSISPLTAFSFPIIEKSTLVICDTPDRGDMLSYANSIKHLNQENRLIENLASITLLLTFSIIHYLFIMIKLW